MRFRPNAMPIAGRESGGLRLAINWLNTRGVHPDHIDVAIWPFDFNNGRRAIDVHEEAMRPGRVAALWGEKRDRVVQVGCLHHDFEFTPSVCGLAKR